MRDANQHKMGLCKAKFSFAILFTSTAFRPTPEVKGHFLCEAPVVRVQRIETFPRASKAIRLTRSLGTILLRMQRAQGSVQIACLSRAATFAENFERAQRVKCFGSTQKLAR